MQVLSKEERKSFKKFRENKPELSYKEARKMYLEFLGKPAYVKYNGRKEGFDPKDFKTIHLERNREAISGWDIYQGKKLLKQRIVQGTCSKPHIYTNIRFRDTPGRQFSVAALVWLAFIGEKIPAGFIVDHKNEDPFNNDPGNLQLLTIGDNTRKAWKIRKNQKIL